MDQVFSSHDSSTTNFATSSSLDSAAQDQERIALAALQELQEQMKLDIQERFAHNLAAFERFMPSIAQQFKSYTPKQKLEFVCSENGIPNLFLAEQDKFFYNCYDPLKLCEEQVALALDTISFKQLCYEKTYPLTKIELHYRYLNEIIDLGADAKLTDEEAKLCEFKSAPIGVLLGVGLGYHIGILCSKVEFGNLLIIEPDLDLFYASLHCFDWAAFLSYVASEQHGIYLMLGQKPDNIFEDLSAYYMHHGIMLSSFMWSMVHYSSPEINELADRFVYEHRRMFSLMNYADNQLFNISQGFSAIEHNLPFIKSKVYMAEEYRNTPLCIVANGPSLSNDLAFLRKYQDKLVIMACGSAIETLYLAGIKPTFYVTIERTDVVEQNLKAIADKDFLKDIICIGTETLYPGTYKYFDENKIALFSKADESFYELAIKKLKDKFSKVCAICNVNPLVGNCALSAAVMLGFKELYIFGMDNGTTREDRCLHPQESKFYQICNAVSKDKDALNKEDTEKVAHEEPVEGNFGGKVYTTATYKTSILQSESVIHSAHQIGVKVYNCADGAKLKGAVPLHSELLELEWQNLKDFPREDFIKHFTQDLTLRLNLSPQELASLIQKPNFNYVADFIIARMQGEGVAKIKTRLGVVSLLQGINEELYKLYNSQESYLYNIFYGSLGSMFSMVLYKLYQTKDEAQSIKVALESIKRISYFLMDLKECFSYLPHYTIDDSYKYYGTKIGHEHGDSHVVEVKLNFKQKFYPKLAQLQKQDAKFVKRYS